MRRPDWRSRLVAYIDAAAAQPFAYGANDCGLFAAGAVEAMTGSDPAVGLRGRYKTLRGGIWRLRDAGWDNHVAMLKSFGTEHPLAEAQVGDIAIVDTPEGPALAVVGGARVHFLRMEGSATVDLMDPNLRPHVYRVD